VLVEFDAFERVPETELELHAARASVLTATKRIREPRRGLRHPNIATPPAFQSTLRNWARRPFIWGHTLGQWATPVKERPYRKETTTEGLERRYLFDRGKRSAWTSGH
jgi:hypothetical protein